MKIREAELVTVDPIDGDKEMWFYTEESMNPFIITLKKNNTEPDKIYLRVEISENESKMIRQKKLEKEKYSLLKILEKRLIGGGFC